MTATADAAPATNPAAQPAAPRNDTTILPIILGVSTGHFLNDLMQSLIPAIYPLLKTNLALDFGQIGLITLVFQGTASLLQPLVGIYTDRHPLPWSLAAGMASTLAGLLLLSQAGSFAVVLLAVALIGLGSSIFHPDSSRIARLAAGNRPGFAQSFFQVGGNAGSSAGPLLAAFIVLPNGQGSVAWFAGVALLGITLLTLVGNWYRREGMRRLKARRAVPNANPLPAGKVAFALAILIALCFSKFVYTASFSSYFTFFLMERFALPAETAQVYLFFYLAAVAIGTIIGGPVGDRIGRKRVIWVSILGVLPLSILVPHLPLYPAVAVAALAGLILASAFPAIIVYAQELMPRHVGTIAGLFFGLAFGMGGIGAAGVGEIADLKGIEYAFVLCSFLPAIGILAAFLPNLRPARA